MKFVRRFLFSGLFLCSAVLAPAQAAAPATPAPTVAVAPAVESRPADQAAPVDASAVAKHNTEAAAALASGQAEEPRVPDFLEHLVDVVLDLFDVQKSGNTATHYVIAGVFLVGAFLLRRIVATLFFGLLRKFSGKTKTTLDDKLYDALEPALAAFITVAGAVAALKVLKLSATSDRTVGYASTVAFSLVVFWLLLRTIGVLLDHAQAIAKEKEMGVAAFMPWIKKTVIALFVVLGVLLIVQSLGVDVKAALAGLGLGGLAFALAAQDTLANVFGAVVVAVDQPFKLGEVVKIGSEIGFVEDIGLRSTKIRKLDRSVLVIPNKNVASENITNLSRFDGRRVEQVIGVTYATTADQMEALVEEFRGLLKAEAEIDPNSVVCYFRDFNASSMDIWMVFNLKNPDFHKHMQLRQRLNFAFMRALEARGLSMAYPTQTIHFDGDIARALVAKRERPGELVRGTSVEGRVL